jgi:guanylate kinase
MSEIKGKLVIFSAPSGSGKTTIVKKILENKDFNFEFSISVTSRSKRENEIDGVDYYFVTADEFRKKINNNEFIEWQEVYNNQYYGTLKSEISRIWSAGKNLVFDVDVVGGTNIKKLFPENSLSVFIKPPSLEELKTRLKNRQTENEESLKKRIAKAEYELTFEDKFDVTIINDNLQTAINETVELVSNFLKK